MSVIDWLTMVLRREEMEYDVVDGENYTASPVNRFRKSWYDLHLFSSFWRVTETTKSVHSFLKTPGGFGYARACAQITPQMLADTMLKQEQCKGGKTSVHSLLADKDLPEQLRTALTSLHQATASLVGSDGHRKLLHRECVAYTLRYGPALQFVMPNIADNKQPLLLIVQGENFTFREEVATTYREMTERLAGDPVGQAIVFELMIRLFFIHVLGVQPERVGWRRGAVKKAAQAWMSDGIAADYMRPWLFGLIAAAFGPVEAQGRGSLHPHILVWLVATELQDLLAFMMRDRDAFQERLNLWMKQLIMSVASVQESAVTELPRSMRGGRPTPCADGHHCAELPPLPLGPNEKRHYAADGLVETATTTELGIEGDEENRDLYFFVPGKSDEEQWQPATHPDFPLRNNAGDVVEPDEWKAEFDEAGRGMWSKPISGSPSGAFPAYRIGDRAETQPGIEPLEELRQALPSEDFIREMCHDARELVIGCAIHVCSQSCYKYHSNKSSHICRHNFYHVVTCTDEDYNEIRRRRRGKPLRGCICIFRETRFGMAGRILTYQVHPWECPTNYAALVAMRCNVDVQDLRRVLPPVLWMPEADLEPTPMSDEKETYGHGAYPQRVTSFSIGAQPDWGWFQHLGLLTTAPMRSWSFRNGTASLQSFRRKLRRRVMQKLTQCTRLAPAQHWQPSWTTTMRDTM